MSVNQNALAVAKAQRITRLKNALNADSVKEQFKNALAENSGAFVASIIDLYGSDSYLQECEPNAVIMECLKAASLKLPISKQLGFAYVVPYKNKGVASPQFQLGYKGYIQLAMRTGQYRYLNAGAVPEGMTPERNILTGQVTFSGQPISDKPQGYFAYLELLNGFSKTIYMTRDEILVHAKRYSKSFGSSSSAWTTNFDAMATKTVLRLLLSHYGVLSTDMATALSADREGAEDEATAEIAAEANQDFIDITPVHDEEPTKTAPDQPQAQAQEKPQNQDKPKGQTPLAPDF